MIDVFFQQLLEYCDCLECVNDEKTIKNALLTALENWSNLTCGNDLLDNERVKIVRLPRSNCCCHDCPEITKIVLPETWIDRGSIEVSVRVRKGLEFTEIPVSSIFDSLTDTVCIETEGIVSCCETCSEYEIIVKYQVGADELPQELLELFCAWVRVYLDYNNLACETCGSSDMPVIEFDETIDLAANIKRYAMNYYKNIIAKYSLCELLNMSEGVIHV